MNISPENAKRIELMYASLPIFTDENYILSLINSFAEFLWNDSKNYDIVTFKKEKYDLFNNINLGVAGNFNEEEFSIAAMEERYKYENFLQGPSRSRNYCCHHRHHLCCCRIR